MCAEKEGLYRATLEKPSKLHWTCGIRVKIKDIDFLDKYSTRYPRALNNIDNHFKIAPPSRNVNNFIPLQGGKQSPGEDISTNSRVCTVSGDSGFFFF